MLALLRIQSRCFLEPVCLLGSHTSSYPTPHPLQTLTSIYTPGQPWGPEQMFLCACLPAPSPRTNMCIHEQTVTPTHTTAAWVVPNDSWISCHNRGCLPPLLASPFPRSSQFKHCLNLHVSSSSPPAFQHRPGLISLGFW